MTEEMDRLAVALGLQRGASQRECPVCGRRLRTPQGYGGHLAHSADAAHSAYACLVGYGRRFA